MEEKKITDKERSKVKNSMQGKGKKYSALAIAGFVFSLLFLFLCFL